MFRSSTFEDIGKYQPGDGFCCFLAYLSQRLIGELIVYSSSGVRRCCCCRRSPFSNISSETARPIKAKFDVEPPQDGGTKVFINDLGHMTKMAVMLKKAPKQKSSSPETEPIALKLSL